MRARRSGKTDRLSARGAPRALAVALCAALLAAAPPAVRAQEPGASEEEADRAADLKKALKKLNGKSAAERVSGAAALGSMGKAARSAIPQLVSRLSDGDPNVRGAAAEALGRIDDGTPKVVSALANALGGKSIARGSAAEGLAEIGAKAQAAIPALMKILPETEDPPVRGQIVRAFGRIGASDPKQKRLLVELTRAELSRSADRDVRLAAAVALVRLGETDPAAVPVLAEVAADGRRDVRTRLEAVEAIGGLGTAGEPAVPQLGLVVKEAFVPDPALPYQDEARRLHGAMRVAAAKALGGLGAAARPAVPALQSASASEDADVSVAAKEALERIRAS